VREVAKRQYAKGDVGLWQKHIVLIYPEFTMRRLCQTRRCLICCGLLLVCLMYNVLERKSDRRMPYPTY
jgi:hypothetical protein